MVYTGNWKCEEVEEKARARLPARAGNFSVIAFRSKRSGLEHAVLLKGSVKGKEKVLVRIHSECLTGDALGSLKCDCGPQLQLAMKFISSRERGVLVYLRQEGRGAGFANKIKAYQLQDRGLDTVEANHALGLPADSREYKEAAGILQHLGVKSVVLLTNNPGKISGLEECGVPVVSRIPLETKPNKFNRRYLKIKKRKLGHILSLK